MHTRWCYIGRLPAVQALLLQVMAGLLLGIMLWAISHFLPDVSFTIGIALALQGIIAAW